MRFAGIRVLALQSQSCKPVQCVWWIRSVVITKLFLRMLQRFRRQQSFIRTLPYFQSLQNILRIGHGPCLSACVLVTWSWPIQCIPIFRITLMLRIHRVARWLLMFSNHLPHVSCLDVMLWVVRVFFLMHPSKFNWYLWSSAAHLFMISVVPGWCTWFWITLCDLPVAPIPSSAVPSTAISSTRVFNL